MQNFVTRVQISGALLSCNSKPCTTVCARTVIAQPFFQRYRMPQLGKAVSKEP